MCIRDRYNEAKERALAGDMSAVMDMRNANDEANKLRNAYGYAAVFANEDINNVKKQINYYGGGSSSGGSSGGGVSSPSPSGNENMYMDGNGTVVEDLSAYLEELYAAQRRQTLANLDNAYPVSYTHLSISPSSTSWRWTAPTPPSPP